jgi:uncharacterized protein YkwD
VILFIFPATAIRYAQAATENSQDSDSTGNEQQQNSSTGSGQEGGSSNTGSGHESGSSNTGSGQESNNAGNEQQQSSSTTENSQQSNSTRNAQGMPGATSPSGSTANNATSPSGSTVSNSTGNMSSADFVNTILEIHNRERAAVSVPPLVWNDTLAARAKTYAEHLIGTSPAEFGHPDKEWVAAHPWLPYEAESLAQEQFFNPYKIHIANATQLAQMAEGWVSEKNHPNGNTGHYRQMVSATTKQVGCAAASSRAQQRDVLDCRYIHPP